MTAYLTPDQLRAVLDPAYSGSGASTDTGSAASMSNTELQVAIDDAQAEVDARLAAVTSVPLATPLPRLVLTLVADIAAYLATLTDRRGDPLTADNPVRLRYARAQQQLADLSQGRIPLPDPLTGQESTTVASAAVNPYDGQLFGPRDAGLRTAGQVIYADDRPRWGRF